VDTENSGSKQQRIKRVTRVIVVEGPETFVDTQMEHSLFNQSRSEFKTVHMVIKCTEYKEEYLDEKVPDV
jgi:hypothetical protein